MEKKSVYSALICGAISAAVEFFLIPNFFMRGVPDWIWMALMLLLPALAAVLLLGKCSIRSLWFSLFTQAALVIVLAQPIGGQLGYHLGCIADDLFDYIAYGMFAFGWILGATAAQALALFAWKKFRR